MKKRPRSEIGSAKTSKKKRTPVAIDGKTATVNRAQILVFNKLSVGMKILGAVQRVNEVDMVISLPGGLTGIVSLREISDLMADRVDQFVDSDENACVVSRVDRSDSGKHIDLTTRPALVNGFTSEAQIHENMLIACTIVSAEPRGYVVELGASKGFLPLKEMDGDRKLSVGQPLMVRVHSKGSSVITVSLRDIAIAKTKSAWNSSLSTLLPGTLVKAVVKEKLADGYLFNFLGAFSGTADYFHIGGREL